MNETQLPKHRKTQVPYEMGNRLARFELSLGAMSKNERVAGTSPSVAGDILGAYEELRWMEPHLSIPMHCCMKMCNQPCPVLEGCTHTHTHICSPTRFVDIRGPPTAAKGQPVQCNQMSATTWGYENKFSSLADLAETCRNNICHACCNLESFAAASFSSWPGWQSRVQKNIVASCPSVTPKKYQETNFRLARHLQ